MLYYTCGCKSKSSLTLIMDYDVAYNGFLDNICTPKMDSIRLVERSEKANGLLNICRIWNLDLAQSCFYCGWQFPSD